MKYLVPEIHPARVHVHRPGKCSSYVCTHQYRAEDYIWIQPLRGEWQLDTMLSPESLAALFIARTNAENSERSQRAAQTRRKKRAPSSLGKLERATR